jgi:hypothetical protein
LTFFKQLSKDQLQIYQLRSQEVRNKRHLQKCQDAFTIYSKLHDIQKVCEELGVKRRQAYRLVAKGKNLNV